MVDKFDHLKPLEDKMEIKEDGLILELDPTKEYWMFVRAGSMLARAVKQGHLRNKKPGKIIFVGQMDEFRFVENSDKIKGIVFEEGD